MKTGINEVSYSDLARYVDENRKVYYFVSIGFMNFSVDINEFVEKLQNNDRIIYVVFMSEKGSIFLTDFKIK